MGVTVTCNHVGLGGMSKNERGAIFKIKCKTGTRASRYEALVAKMGRIRAVLYLRKWFPVYTFSCCSEFPMCATSCLVSLASYEL